MPGPRRAKDEAGVAIVLYTVLLPLFLVFAVFAVDVANWYVHHRHLQTQADAAALAAVRLVTPNGPCAANPATANGNVASVARQFAGVKGSADAFTPYNLQVGGRGPAFTKMGADGVSVNTSTYYRKAGDSGPAADDTDTRPPCTAGAVDVKLTEIDLPGLFGTLGLANYINAHARAQLLTLTSQKGQSPIGVPDPTPDQAYAWLLDESGGKCGGTKPCVVASGPLTKNSSTENVGGTPMATWESSAANLLNAQLPSTTGADLSVVVGLSGLKATDSSNTITSDIAKWCATTAVVCYDQTAWNNDTDKLPAYGLSYVRTFRAQSDNPVQTTETKVSGQTTFTAAAPRLRDVWLVPASQGNSTACAQDGYFRTTSGCTVTIRARVDFGTFGNNAPDGNPQNAKLCIVFNTDLTTVECPKGANSTKNGGMQYVTVAGVSYWQTIKPVTIPAAPSGSGRTSISLIWEQNGPPQNGQKPDKLIVDGQTCDPTNTNPCGGSFGPVMYSTLGNPDDPDSTGGPLALVSVTEPSPPSGSTSVDAHSLVRCAPGASDLTPCTHGLKVKVAVKGALTAAQSVNADPVSLRIISGSRNQALQCGPGTNLQDDLLAGCTHPYRVASQTESCPSRSVLWASTGDWPCVAVQTGGSIGQFGSGLNGRILCGGQTCPNNVGCTAPNNWKDPDYGFGTAGWQQNGDPRFLQVFIVPFGSFAGQQGQGTVPVLRWATMYVTGWQAQGSNANPCQNNANTDATHRDEPANSGEMKGYFVAYTKQVDDGGSSNQQCNPNGIETCVAVLTK